MLKKAHCMRIGEVQYHKGVDQMLIAVDHGNKQIKTVHGQPFTSGLRESLTQPLGDMVIQYGKMCIRDSL